MANVRKRDGGTSCQVRWLLGGGRPGPGREEAAETFTSRCRALAFAAEVEEAGHQWPINAEGIRWTTAKGYVAGDAPALRYRHSTMWRSPTSSTEPGR
jgi:hypothetical protein